MDEQRLSEIEARANAATPGPWTASWDGEVYDDRGRMLARVFRPPGTDRDDTFIAHARQDVPELVAEVRQLKDENASLKVRADLWDRAVTEAKLARPASLGSERCRCRLKSES